MEIDLLIIGGGINGCGIAADAAGRGLSVLLCEQEDLAFGTSSSSTKLIHGGLRYLENFQFKLVRSSLKEREILMRKAPHLIQPMRFILPYNNQLRSSAMVRLGLMLYDLLHLDKILPSSKKIDLQYSKEGGPLKGQFKFGFSYFDGWTDDARLVVLNAIAAREHGAHILTRTRCKFIKRDGNLWQVKLNDLRHNRILKLQAKAVINAAGPWVADVIENVAKLSTHTKTRLIQGSHIVIPKLYEGLHAYVLQNPDGRILFVLPYQEKFTLIGTTEIEYEGDPNLSATSNRELNYLCNSVNRFFSKQIYSDQIVWSYSGVRLLYDDEHTKNRTKISREYYLEIDRNEKATAATKEESPHIKYAPLISIFGGKLTTYRKLAEDVLMLLQEDFPNMGPPWTAASPLPGGDCDNLSFSEFLKALEQRYPWLPLPLIERYANSYGSLCHTLLADCHRLKDLGQHFGENLFAKEIFYLVKNEWVQKVDDLIWRRTKLGLLLNPSEVEAIELYLKTLVPSDVPRIGNF